MELQYPPEWKFADGNEIPPVPSSVAMMFHDWLVKIAATSDTAWDWIESFKDEFGDQGTSSNIEWAHADLASAMRDNDLNAVIFLDRLYSCVVSARRAGLASPTVEQLNSVLRRNQVDYELRPPDLVRADGDAIVGSTELGHGAGSDRYHLGELLGRGGFGEVFVATRETSAGSFEYALKRLDPHPFVADPDKAASRFKREVSALQHLQHRGIISYLDAGFDRERRPFVVMPRIHGHNIRNHTEGWAALDKVQLMREVLFAVQHAHDEGVLHRDLKPSNILVRSSDGQPIVVDFGNAFILDEMDRSSLTTKQVGSLGYIPPEVQLNPKERTPLQDVFACAVITYELIARRLPNHQDYLPLAAQHQTPASLDAVISRAIGPKPSRPQSAKELWDELSRACWPPLP
jgi:hypothetical protein